MDTKKLRQKILDLAIHGKLVPQDPNDEPASVLLERIRAEKETLIKEGKIKRAKNTTTSDTPHYENVPVGWCSTTIGEVFSLQAGKNISANDIHEYSPMFPYACYGGNGIRGYVDIYNKEGQFPIIGRQGALCGNVNFATGKFYATEHAVVVTCFAGVNVDWARLVLEAMNLNQYATATAQPGLSVATVVEVNLLLPPLEEQKRIADFVLQYLNIIECMGAEANDLMQGLKNAKSKILDLAIHGKLVTQDPTDEPASELLKRINPKADISCDNPQYQNSHFEIPDSWRWCIINDLFEITMGQSPEGETYNNTYGIEFHQGKINFTEKYLDKSGVFTTKPTKIAKAGSILMCVRAPVGIINITQREVCIGRGLCALKCKDIIDPDYAFYALQTIQSELESKATGSTFKAISCSIIRDEPLPLPPYEEQKRIVLKIQELNECICSILNQIEA